MANAPRYQQQPSQRRQEPQAPETPKSSAPVLAPEPAPKASAEPAIASQFVAPDTHVLARWKGPGKFSGILYTYPAGKEQPFCIGTTLAYFPKDSVLKLKDQFERHEATAAGPAPVKEVVKTPLAASPEEGYVLARWKGPGKFSGVYYSLTGEKKPHASGTVEGYFDAASVKKLHGHFEAL